jgi:two-component system OmpR family response regulator
MRSQQHIMIVEDDRGIATLVEKSLKQNGFTVTLAGDGRALDRALRDGIPDLLLLDLMLPGEDGLSIARRLGSERQIPIIMLTAMGEEADRVAGLELGADDYIVKPFSSRELIARIRAVLRRAHRESRRIVPRMYRFAGWSLDSIRRELSDPDGVRVELTGGEFQLLQIFCEHPREVLSRDRLLRLTQENGAMADQRSIDTLVSRIRRKIEGDPREAEFLKTIRLGGYLFTPEVSTL